MTLETRESRLTTVLVRTRLNRATTWHVVSLVAGLLFIMLMMRKQWFFFDEWAFLKLSGPGLLSPHVGHWSTSPNLIYNAYRTFFGLESYFPFALTVVLLHLLAAHLIWRLARKAGANDWVVTALVAMFIFLGAGAENIFWAFQIGFIGALVLGLTALTIVSREVLTRRAFITAVAVSIFGLTWSGTIIPVIVAATLVLWRKHGWRRATIFVLVNAVIYLSWYVLFAIGNPNNPDTGGFGIQKLFVKIPEFLGVMFILGWQHVFPVIGMGVLSLLALVVWAILTIVKKRVSIAIWPAVALAIAALVFAFLSAFSRANFSVGTGGSSRYIYVLFLFLLPIFAVAITRLTRERATFIAIATAVIVLLAGYQARVLYEVGQAQIATEQGSERLISASLFLYLEEPHKINLTAKPDARWAPDLQMKDLIALYKGHYIAVDYFGAADLAAAKSQVLISP